MQEKVVLSIDVGTQSTRALLINNYGNILGMAKSDHVPAYFSMEADWAEQRPEFYWEHICQASQMLKSQKPELWERIEAVTITTIRATYICLDSDKKPLRPAFLWLDKRKAEGQPKLSWWMNAAVKAVGMEQTAHLQWRISVCNWLQQNEPEIWKKTAHFSFLSGYLIYCLSGQLIDSISALVGHVPFNHKRRDWMTARSFKRFVFDIEPQKLSEFKEAGEILGYISTEAAEATGIAAGLPLYASGSDKSCETIGMGCITPEKAAISFGTTSTVCITTDTYMEPDRFMPAYVSVMPGAYNPEIQIYRGYWLISWFKREFASKEVEQAKKLGILPEELLNRRLKEIPPGCEGLVFQPYFTPNLTMPVARGAVIGFSDVHTRVHIYRAIIEGINFALMHGLKKLEKKSGVKIKEIYLGGGGSRSDEICQITANMFGLPAIRTQTNEGSGIGSAMAAFVGMGVYPDFAKAAEAMVRKKDIFMPDMEQHRIYRKIYQDIFMEIYGRLAPLYSRQNIIHKMVKRALEKSC
ncbi:carbohydrate kinase [Clostridiales bacterium COT073_COT-073]|nr:carbohydrate kinase [Clostridiales bacterium COT073_COT-073]